jgi:hypothetical protein
VTLTRPSLVALCPAVDGDLLQHPHERQSSRDAVVRSRRVGLPSTGFGLSGPANASRDLYSCNPGTSE